jgi:hypothetical protein
MHDGEQGCGLVGLNAEQADPWAAAWKKETCNLDSLSRLNILRLRS